jgi:hypothetical protein
MNSSQGVDVLFIHIPKAAGSSMLKALGRRAKLCPTLRWPEARGHLTYRQYSQILKSRGISIDAFCTFAVVRNPWDWHLSWYSYVKSDKHARNSGLTAEHTLFQAYSFHDYVAWLADGAPGQSKQGYLSMNLCDWIINEAGICSVSHILRLESLEKDFRQMLELMGVIISPKLPHVNRSKPRLSYRQSYNDKSAAVIQSLHRRDIDLFGYQF